MHRQRNIYLHDIHIYDFFSQNTCEDLFDCHIKIVNKHTDKVTGITI